MAIFVFPSSVVGVSAFGTPSVYVASTALGSVSQTNPYSSCDPYGAIANAQNDYNSYFNNQIVAPVNSLMDQTVASNNAAIASTIGPILAQHNIVLAGASATVNITATDPVAPTSPINNLYTVPTIAKVGSNTKVTHDVQNLPVSSLNSLQALAASGLPLVTDSKTAEAALRNRGINIINGNYFQTGYLDISCVKVLYSLLGGPDPCVALTPSLSKPDGDFTLVITHKQIIISSPANSCGPAQAAPLPTGTCATPFVSNQGTNNNLPNLTTIAEHVLGVDVSIFSVLATWSALARTDLMFYVFHNTIANAQSKNIALLKKYGFTQTEIVDIITNTSTSQLQSCIIADPAGVLSFVRNNNDPDIVAFAPNNVDPSPYPDDLFNNIASQAENPPPTPDGLPNYDNVPALMLGAIDPNKLTDCLASISAGFDSMGIDLSAIGSTVTSAFSSALSMVQGIQPKLTSIGNTITSTLSMLEQYGQKFPGSFVKCMFPGAGVGVNFALPKAAIDAMNLLLGFGIDGILKSFQLFDALLTGMLQGFCISASLVTGLVGSSAKTALQAANTATAGLLGAAIGCASFNLPWPDFILNGLQCLLKIIQLLERLTQAAINNIRSAFGALQTFSLQFGYSSQAGAACNPAVVIGALAAINAQMTALTS